MTPHHFSVSLVTLARAKPKLLDSQLNQEKDLSRVAQARLVLEWSVLGFECSVLGFECSVLGFERSKGKDDSSLGRLGLHFKVSQPEYGKGALNCLTASRKIQLVCLLAAKMGFSSEAGWNHSAGYLCG
jgi:hypothetical protein